MENCLKAMDNIGRLATVTGREVAFTGNAVRGGEFILTTLHLEVRVFAGITARVMVKLQGKADKTGEFSLVIQLREREYGYDILLVKVPGSYEILLVTLL